MIREPEICPEPPIRSHVCQQVHELFERRRQIEKLEGDAHRLANDIKRIAGTFPMIARGNDFDILVQSVSRSGNEGLELTKVEHA